MREWSPHPVDSSHNEHNQIDLLSKFLKEPTNCSYANYKQKNLRKSFKWNEFTKTRINSWEREKERESLNDFMIFFSTHYKSINLTETEIAYWAQCERLLTMDMLVCLCECNADRALKDFSPYYIKVKQKIHT